MLPLQLGLVEEGIDRFTADVVGAIPRVLSGVVFLVLAAVLAKLVMMVVRAGLRRVLPKESDVYRRFLAGIVAAFLWFSIGLSFLTVVGLDGIASSMGTAAGFLALGVSYSLSNMIADAVAGVYLLRDPDFTPGDQVTVGDTSGTVESIELRKTRFRTDDGTTVRGNAEIEKRWTKVGAKEDEGGDSAAGDGPVDQEAVSGKVRDGLTEQAPETPDGDADGESVWSEAAEESGS